MGPNGENQAQPDPEQNSDRNSAWAPDGGSILFISDRDDPNFEIYWMAFDGSPQTRITYDPRSTRFPTGSGR